MENTMIKSQSAAAVNSAVSKIFSKKSVLDLAVLAYKRMEKSPNGNSDKISVVVGDGYRVTMDCGMDKNECYLVLNIYLEEKIGNRYVRMREYHSGWADMATEYMACGSWKSVVVYAIKDAIESMVSKILDNYIKDGDKYSIALWEDMTGMVYMAPALDAAPMLEEAPELEEDNDITEEGYSVAGLAYAKEHTSGVSMADIIRAVSEEHWNFESVVKESQWTRFTNDSFRDLIWSTCWAEYLVGHTDEALEAETRYIMDFDSVYDELFDELWPYMSTYDDSCGGCELWVNAWYVVERAAEIIEESGARWIDWDEFPDYVMDAFLGGLYGFDTFTERVMSELEGGDIVSIMPYDDGLHLSFVDDEAEVSEAPALEEAPELEEDNITEEGYSVAGLRYLAETMPVVPVDAIVEGVNEYFSDCYVLEKCCGGYYVCDFEKFADIVWEYYVWPSVYTMTDEALEAETRCSMEFNLRLRYMLEKGYFEWLEIDNGIVRSNVVVAA